MAEFTINNKNLNISHILKIRAGQEIPALEAAKKDGADNLFFSAGNDTYVVSGIGLDLKGIKRGTQFSFADQQAVVTAVDNQVNSAKDGAKYLTKWILAGTAILGTWMGIEILEAFKRRSSLASVGIVEGAMVLGVQAAVVLGGGALYGALRPSDLESLKQFASAEIAPPGRVPAN